jgi:DNA-binding response OmpR family regulator
MSLLDRLKQLFADAKQPKEVSSEPPAPLVEMPDGQNSIPERRAKTRINAIAGTKALVIDDSATIVAMLGRMLRQNDYTVLEAEDAEKGLEIAYRDNPAIIFLDIVLPGMSGFTALRHLRHDARTKDIPIIMISGNEQATEQFYVQRIGADDFMKKPFSRAELFSRIEKLLNKDFIPVRFNEYVHRAEADADHSEDVKGIEQNQS